MRVVPGNLIAVKCYGDRHMAGAVTGSLCHSG